MSFSRKMFKYRVFRIKNGYYSLFDATDDWDEALIFASILANQVGEDNVVILSVFGKEVFDEYE